MSHYDYEVGHIRTDRGMFHDKGNIGFDIRHKDFAGGAKGDGHDDTAAITAAIAEAVSTGGHVIIPPGEWSHTGITLTGATPDWRVLLRGAGPRSSFLINTHATNPSITVNGIHQLKICDLGIRGNLSGATNGIQFLTSAGFQNFGVLLENLWIHASNNGIVGAPFSSTIRNCLIGGNSTDDSMAGGTAHNQKNGIVLNACLAVNIENCWIADLQDGFVGIVIQSGNQAVIRDCNISSETASASWKGIELAGSGTRYVVEGCNFECDAANTMTAGVQFSTNTWRGGRLAANTYIPGSGTITNKIDILTAGADDDALLVVNDGVAVDMNNIATGYVLGMPYIAPTADGSGRYVGMASGSWSNARFDVSGWNQSNVAASQTAVIVQRFDSGTGPNEWIPVRDGYLTGIVVKSNEARTAGTLTVEAFVNGTGTGLTAVLDGTNTTSKATTQAWGADAFSAGDSVDVRITTDGSWAPTTADILVSLEVRS